MSSSRGNTAAAQRKPSILQEISLPSTEDEAAFETAITSAQRGRPSQQPSEIEAMLYSLSDMTISTKDERSTGNASSRRALSKPKASTHYTSRYVLREADCIDDYSDYKDDEDEDTDLSGFIVDDDADISYHISSGDDTDDNYQQKEQPPKRSRRRLQRGHRRVVDSDDSDKENGSEPPLAHRHETTENGSDKQSQSSDKAAAIIDLTASPEINPRSSLKSSAEASDNPFVTKASDLDQSFKGLSLFDSMMRLSPPRNAETTETEIGTPEQQPSQRESPKTPTRTPPPPRLSSPSKLFSPSKGTTTQRSPHRQSTDAFWDHHTVNDWNDTYSPRKAPKTSPAKNPLARFAIWSDEDPSDDDPSHDFSSSSDTIPSPCASPTKARSQSPMKSPEKAARAAYLVEKRESAARKKAFDATKVMLAADLLDYLDEHVTAGQLNTLSASTGGVQIKWSKTLRSTAGRANWRRSVTKPSGSPVKGSPVKGMVGGQKVKVEHFANIELADKVIDCEERLVNTLAHEFCHLANFMVSNVRDQPHGASFKAWAVKATACLAAAREPGAEDHDAAHGADDRVRPGWRACKVTTKHSYEIEWKYLWVCAGREQSAAMTFLNVRATDGSCGAEYGRHSKSIDTERMRCGRCKGKLVQVRPVPRAAPNKKKAVAGVKVEGRNGKSSAGPVGSRNASRSGSGSDSSHSSSGDSVLAKLKEIEVIELSD